MNSQEKALMTFMGQMEEIRGQLAEIQGYIDNHMNTCPDGINWGHVGSAGKMASDLNYIMVFLGLKEEEELV